MLNFQDDMGTSFISEGWHTCRVVNWETVTGASTPRIEFELWNPDAVIGNVKAKMFLSEKAKFRYRAFSIACGITADERHAVTGDSLMEISEKMAQKIVGRAVDVLFGKDEKNDAGKQYMECQDYRPASAELPPAPKREPKQEVWKSASTASDSRSDYLPF